LQVHHHVSKSGHQPRSAQRRMPVRIVSILGLLAIICTTFATIQTASAHSASAPTKPASTRHAPAKPATSINGMIDQVFGAYAPAAKRIATCESSMNPKAINSISIGGSHAEGLFQILYPSTWKGTSQASQSPYNASANIKAAHDIFVRDGHSWREWACQP
jgi:hypothetical protein